MLISSVFIMVTNFVLVFGGLLSVAIFLIVLSAVGESHLPTVWRVCFGIGIILPVTVFYFRLRMLSSKLYRRGAIKREPIRCAIFISSMVSNSYCRSCPLLACLQEVLEVTDWHLWRLVPL